MDRYNLKEMLTRWLFNPDRLNLILANCTAKSVIFAKPIQVSFIWPVFQLTHS